VGTLSSLPCPLAHLGLYTDSCQSQGLIFALGTLRVTPEGVGGVRGGEVSGGRVQHPRRGFLPRSGSCLSGGRCILPPLGLRNRADPPSMGYV
jgi:hypothetical protein